MSKTNYVNVDLLKINLNKLPEPLKRVLKEKKDETKTCGSHENNRHFYHHDHGGHDHTRDD